MEQNANKHGMFLSLVFFLFVFGKMFFPEAGLKTFPNDSDAVIHSRTIDALNNLRAEFIKRVVGAKGRERKKEFENFEKLWAGRKVHFYSQKSFFS